MYNLSLAIYTDVFISSCWDSAPFFFFIMIIPYDFNIVLHIYIALFVLVRNASL